MKLKNIFFSFFSLFAANSAEMIAPLGGLIEWLCKETLRKAITNEIVVLFAFHKENVFSVAHFKHKMLGKLFYMHS